MASPFRDYLIGLSVIAVAAGGYHFTAAKWLEPPVVEYAPIARRPLSDNDESLADLYPADAWQRGRAIRLKTQDGMLLFQNWEQNKDERDGGKKWRLWPITMVIGRGLSADESSEPILIEAAEGAVIEFSAALDVMSGVAPTIQRGQLLGEVHIQRVRATDTAAHNPSQSIDPTAETLRSEDASAYRLRRSTETTEDDQTLDIRTANVGIDRRKIWTTEAIEMQVGRAVMVGRDLTLHLAASQGSPTSKSSLARSLDRMELIYLRELTLPLGSSSTPGSTGEETDRGVVEVHCDGRIEYDFAMDQLLLDRNVRLVHRTQDAQPPHSAYRAGVEHPLANGSTTLGDNATGSDQLGFDQFQCNTLRLTLRDPLNSSRERVTALDWIDRMEATGTPLRISMGSQQFDLTAGEILFDPLQGWLVARSRPNPALAMGQRGAASPATNNDSVVRIRRGDLHAALSQIVYRFDPKVPQQLGSVEVEGAGKVDYVALDSVFKSFSWRDSLRVAPLDVATADDLNVRFGVWCEGAIRSLLADGGSFETDRIEGVIKPTTPTSTPISQSAKGSQGSSANLDQSWFPDRFAAIGNVRIRSRSLHASTPQMNLFFEQRAVPPTPAGETPEVSSIRNWVSQPAASADGTVGNVAQSKTKSTPDRESPPATIRGDQVTAKLTFGDGQLTATDLSVVGNVEVTHSLQLRQKGSTDSTAGRSRTPVAETMTAVMTGDQLRLRDSGGSGDVLQLGSRSQVPARLELGDGYFVGPEIQVRPHDNYIWIPSAGEFVVPSAFLPALGDGLAAGATNAQDAVVDPASDTRWTQSPRGRFGGSMTFDGRVATLNGGVLLQAAIAQGREPSELKMLGDELTFTLETPVNLRSPGTFRATQLSQVSLRQTSDQPVELHVDRYADDGVRDSRHEMVVSVLTWLPGQAVAEETSSPAAASPLQGQIVAPGAGSYRGWFRTPPPQPEPEDVATANRTGYARAGVYDEGMIEDNRTAGRQFERAGETPLSAPSITGVHLIYQDGMRGDLIARSLTFDRGVRIGRKIVPDFNARFDAGDMDLLSDGELTLDCDQLRLAVDPTVVVRQSRFAETARSSQSNLALEVQAAGGILFRTRTDKGLSEATADRCGYAIAKDLVTIVGVPGRPARFRHTDVNGRQAADLAWRVLNLRLDPFEVLPSQIEGMSTGYRPSDFPTKR
ncbi:hypothetical protein [Allorhodopirellula heiligendammensis]|uniref:OstA-like protein n=1 Tax=Allorhodopirellula heiligendammensis TaxID=2714739 RepID=A0A5C6BXQ0_9BACT|nr:hypothetical protein [Allorhodopirellula heiligendammensis]TWU16765.1 hypothetical protein Poly21_39710 [Allorhodopirellula heiligendammensis]